MNKASLSYISFAEFIQPHNKEFGITMKPANIIKIILTGDRDSGKTTFLNFIKKSPQSQNIKTQSMPDYHIGMDFCCYNIEIGANQRTILIYDYSLQSKYQFLREPFKRATNAGLVIIDLTKRDYYQGIKRHVAKINAFTATFNLPIIVFGTKKDLIQPEDLSKFHKDFAKLKKVCSQLLGRMSISLRVDTFSIEILAFLQSQLARLPGIQISQNIL